MSLKTLDSFSNLRVSNYKKTNIPPNNSDKQPGKHNTQRKMLLYSSLVALAVVGSIYVIKSNKNTSIKKMKAYYNHIITEFPKDKKYYETLAQGINLPVKETYKLASITGPQQLKHILQNASKEDFIVGKNLEGVKNKTLRINLHNHTTASDGHLTPRQIINQANRWADEIFKVHGNDGKAPFVLNITDHDTLDGAKEAVKIIAENPEKYKNLKLVLGSEISVSHINPKDVKSPMNFELIGYCLNPFDKNMNDLLNNLKNNRKELLSLFTKNVQKKYPEYDFNFEDMKGFHRNLKNMRTNGVIYLQEEYINNKIMFTDFSKDINEKIILDTNKKINITQLFRQSKDNYYTLKDTNQFKGTLQEYYRDYIFTPYLQKNELLNNENKDIYNKIFERDFSEQKRTISEIRKNLMPTVDETKGYIITPEEVFKTARKSNEHGFFGVAHPGLIKADMYSNDVENVCNINGYDKGEHLGWRLYKHLKDIGGDYFKAAEVNYQSYPYKDNNAQHWVQYMGENKANEFNLLKTGGIDCHKPSIFKKHLLLTEKEINENNLRDILYENL